jgi:hypothetical protein
MVNLARMNSNNLVQSFKKIVSACVVKTMKVTAVKLRSLAELDSIMPNASMVKPLEQFL